MNIAVIGGGAAGFFAALNLAESLERSKHEICIFEGSSKLMSKVLISGGGRCNITNAMLSTDDFLKNYPRGEKELRQVFSRFNNTDLINWFESRGIKLKTEPDGRVFPESDSSETIVDFFVSCCNKSGVKIFANHKLINIDIISPKEIPAGASVSVNETNNKFSLSFSNGKQYSADYVLITTGGSSKSENFSFLKNTKHTITPLLPSLFSFNIRKSVDTSDSNPALSFPPSLSFPRKCVSLYSGLSGRESTIPVPPSFQSSGFGTQENKELTQNPKPIGVERFLSLAGISVKNIRITLSKKLYSGGDILITHNGISGPAVLKLSAFAAKELHKQNYNFPVYINWAYSHRITNLQIALDTLKNLKQTLKNKTVSHNPQFTIPHRLWEYLVSLSGIPSETKWLNISSKQLLNLAGNIFSFSLIISGKTTNKEEFVTCGGINLKEVDFKTMQSKLIPNIFFAGEVLDIDGITGGFNFQSAWSTAFISANSIIENIRGL